MGGGRARASEVRGREAKGRTGWTLDGRLAMGAPKDLPSVGIGFQGKPIVDVRTLNLQVAETLSRAQVRDIVYSLGQDKPAWETNVLRDQIKLIVHSMTTGNVPDIKQVEAQLGITLPRGNGPYQFRSVPDEKRKPRQYVKNPDRMKKPSNKGSVEKGPKDRFCASCGQRARSNCYYRCCKQCCVQLKNPCTVHVLTGDKVVGTKRKGYGSLLPVYRPEFNAFTCIPDAPTKQMPKLRDLRENLEAYHEEAAEVLEWRRENMRTAKKAEEEAVVEALDRYERNAGLLATLMKVESLEDVIAETTRVGEATLESARAMAGEESSAGRPEESRLGEGRSLEGSLETYNSAPTPLSAILKKLDQAKTIEELNETVQQIGALKGASPESIQGFSRWANSSNGTTFKVLKKDSAPRPNRESAVELLLTK